MKRITNQFARVGGMQSRRFHLLIAVFCLVVAGLMPETVTANSPPTVSNVTAYQRTDGVVVISYVLRDADYDPCMIAVQVSDDGGQSWAIIPSPEALSGDLVNVLPNYQTSPSGGVQIYSHKPTIFPSKRTIYWNSRVDLPGVYGENYRIRIIADDRVEQRMVFIPGGTFQMGDSFSEGNSNERPIHTVTLSPYYMSQYEVTNGAYCQFLNSMYNPDVSPEHSPIFLIEGVVYGGRHIRPPDAREYYYPFCDTTVSNPNSLIEFSNGTFSVCKKNGRNMSNDPMVFVSWYGAAAFCDWQSQQDGRESCYGLMLLFTDYTKDGYRLPTEAEWEYAARGGLSGKRFPWGDTITHEQANYYSTNSYSYDISPTRGYHPDWNDGILPYTSSVGRFTPNGYALYDMAGNVFEWCNDWYGLYDSLPQNDPRGPASGTGRILRGGGWGFDAYNCRAGFRGVFSPSERYDFLGFRLARNYAGEITTVPNLFMMSRANAQAAIAAAGLVVGTVTEDTSPVVPKGCVMGQNLAVGSNVPMASVVNIVVSQGPPIGGIIYYLVRVPDVIGKTQSEAREAIEAARLVVGTVTQEYSETVSQGRVISQNPSGGSYSTEGSTVDLVVSKGRPATVPNVVGMYYLLKLTDFSDRDFG